MLFRSIKLKKILDAKGLFIDFPSIPHDNDYFDSSAFKAKFVLFSQYPEIYVEKYGNQWLYSRETVASIPGLYKKTFPLGEDFLVSIFPAIQNQKFFGLYTWQLLGLVFLAVVIFII